MAGAHLFKSDTVRKLGKLAERALAEYAPDAGMLAEAVGIRSDLAATVYERVKAKLGREAVEDFRIDFEDGFGELGLTRRKDAAVDAAAAQLARGLEEGDAVAVYRGRQAYRARRAIQLRPRRSARAGSGWRARPSRRIPQRLVALCQCLSNAAEARMPAARPLRPRPIGGLLRAPPSRIFFSSSGRRRLRAMAAITHHSATDSALPVPAEGTLATVMPRSAAAFRSTPSRPAPHCWMRRRPVMRSMISPSMRDMAGMRTGFARHRGGGRRVLWLGTRTPGRARPRCSRSAAKPDPATTTRGCSGMRHQGWRCSTCVAMSGQNSRKTLVAASRPRA